MICSTLSDLAREMYPLYNFTALEISWEVYRSVVLSCGGDGGAEVATERMEEARRGLSFR